MVSVFLWQRLCLELDIFGLSLLRFILRVLKVEVDMREAAFLSVIVVRNGRLNIKSPLVIDI